MNITALKALIRKDLILFFSNKRSLIITIAAPILIAAFFGNLMSPKTDKLSKVPIAIIDLDRSELSQKIVAAMASDATFDIASAATTQIDATTR